MTWGIIKEIPTHQLNFNDMKGNHVKALHFSFFNQKMMTTAEQNKKALPCRKVKSISSDVT